MRRALLTICTIAGITGCHGSDGAVTVRWRIVDLTLGDTYDPKSNSITDRDGFCCPDMHIVNKQCDFTSPWVVRTLAVTLADPSSGAAQPSNTEPFKCGDGEETTPFTLPTGSWAISLAVDVVDGSGMPVPVAVPPPEVHSIVKGEIVNLQVIELGVHPLGTSSPVPLPPARSMVTF